MAFETFDDSEPVTNAPLVYTTISTSALADSLQPSVFPFLLQSTQTRNTVLTCINDIVSAPHLPPSSVTPIVNACITALSPAGFSDLLETPNIEGHTALYWAIVNDRREAFSVLSESILKFSPFSFSELRHGCMVTSDQALFARLNLGYVNSKEKPLTRSLGCRDEIHVDPGDGLGENQFVACFRIMKFQKRMRATQDVYVEFVARGRIWALEFLRKTDGRWYVGFRLSRPSLPARPKSEILIKAHKGKPGCAVPPQGLRFCDIDSYLLVPEKHGKYSLEGNKDIQVSRNHWPMTDWLMDDNTRYLDGDGALHVEILK